jgi:hypothetical protein
MPVLHAPTNPLTWADACAARLERTRVGLAHESQLFARSRVIVQEATLGSRSLAGPTWRVMLELTTPEGGTYETRIELGLDVDDGEWNGYDGAKAAFLWRDRDRREGRIEVSHAHAEMGELFITASRHAVDDCLEIDLAEPGYNRLLNRRSPSAKDSSPSGSGGVSR